MPVTHYGMQAMGRPSAAEDIAAGNAAESAVRVAAIRAREAAKTKAANSGMDNSLSRPSAYSTYQQNGGQLAAFHPPSQQGPTPSGAPMTGTAPDWRGQGGRTLSTAEGNAILGSPDPSAGPAHDAALAVAGRNQTAMTPYGPISSSSPSGNEGRAVTTPTGVSHFGGFNSQQEQGAARTQLLADNPEIGQEGTAANQAFVSYAQQHGEQAAHQNVANILAGGSALNPTADNSATAIPSGGLPQTPKPTQPVSAGGSDEDGWRRPGVTAQAQPPDEEGYKGPTPQAPQTPSLWSRMKAYASDL